MVNEVKALNILKSYRSKYLRDIFVQLLKDTNMEVKGALIVRLNHILPYFTGNNEEQKVN